MLDFILDTLLQRPRVIVDGLYENATQPAAADAVTGHGLIQQPIARLAAWLMTISTILGFWVILCSTLRFRHEKAMLRRFDYPSRASFARMTNDDAQQIMKYILDYEFPLMYKLSLQFAIFKTYAFSTISSVLANTKSFSDPEIAPKRYEDTTVIFGEFTVNSPTSERAIQAIARMNHLHSPYKKSGKISNQDLLYTLAVCVMEPIRFIELYEWRPLNKMEICAVGTFWKSIGDAMEIEYNGYLAQHSWKDGIEFVEDITAWAKRYEVDAMKPHRSNRKLSDALVGLLFSLAPAPQFTLQVLTVLMGDRVREAFMYPQPGIFACLVAFASLNLRRLFLRFLCLPRLKPLIFFSEPDPHTGRIKHFDYLVDPYYNPPTFWSRWGPMALIFRLLGGKVPGAPGTLPEGFVLTDMVAAHSFHNMFRKDVEILPDAAKSIPLTVGATSLTTLPDGTPVASHHYRSYVTAKLVPDYDTVQSGIDKRTHAAVFAHVDMPGLADPRQVLKTTLERLEYGTEYEMRAALEFQFVLRYISDNEVCVDPIWVAEELVEVTSDHLYGDTGLATSSCKISSDGVVAVQLEMSEDLLAAVDNFYHIQRALKSIAARGRLRLSFFYATETDSSTTSLTHGSPHEAMCKNRLNSRFHFVHPSAEFAGQFAAGILEVDHEYPRDAGAYVFATPNWLTYDQGLGTDESSTSPDVFMTWGIRNSETSINFPDGCGGRRLEFGDVDSTANMYLVAAALSELGADGIDNSSKLEAVPQAIEFGMYHPAQTHRIPKSGVEANSALINNPLLRRLFMDGIQGAHYEMRKKEEDIIVEAVRSGRASSARELLEKWY
ncbi:hypothetical protein diail_5547 [Diaporthe ilicicola]|nr:hypothetical protein diail_5547 [Diaporthe ilicicola]